MLMQKKKNKNK